MRVHKRTLCSKSTSTASYFEINYTSSTYIIISIFHWFMEELKYSHKIVENIVYALTGLNILHDILRKIGEATELTTWLTKLNETTFCDPKCLQFA